MKVLIIYSTKNGCARECASILASHIEDNFDVTLWDLASGMPDLSDYGFEGGLRFTTRVYFPPNGESYDGIGITPDVIVELDEKLYGKNIYDITDAEDNQLQAAIDTLK